MNKKEAVFDRFAQIYSDCRRCEHGTEDPATHCLPCEYSDSAYHPDFKERNVRT